MTRPETVNGSGGLTGILVPASRRSWTLLSVCSSWSFRRCVAAAMLAVLGAGEYRGEIDIIFIYSPGASSGVGGVGGGTVGGKDVFRAHEVACGLFIGGADGGRGAVDAGAMLRRPPARESVGQWGLRREGGEERGSRSSKPTSCTNVTHDRSGNAIGWIAPLF